MFRKAFRIPFYSPYLVVPLLFILCGMVTVIFWSSLIHLFDMFFCPTNIQLIISRPSVENGRVSLLFVGIAKSFFSLASCLLFVRSAESTRRKLHVTPCRIFNDVFWVVRKQWTRSEVMYQWHWVRWILFVRSRCSKASTLLCSLDSGVNILLSSGNSSCSSSCFCGECRTCLTN